MMIMNMREEESTIEVSGHNQQRRQHPPQINTDLDETYEGDRNGTITAAEY